jgi:hypothetical protein
MNYALRGTTSHLKPRREEPLARAGHLGSRPGADSPPMATRRPRSWLTSFWQTASRRRRTSPSPTPRVRESATSGVSPIAGATSRGVAFLIRR